jgi:hypothetical protein
MRFISFLSFYKDPCCFVNRFAPDDFEKVIEGRLKNAPPFSSAPPAGRVRIGLSEARLRWLEDHVY